MKLKYITKLCTALLIVVANFGCDQASKKIVRRQVNPNQNIEVLKNHLTITNVENSGAFLSLGNSLPKTAKNIFLSLIPLIIIIVAFGYVITKRNLSNILLIAICFMIGGGIGNIFDRIVYGSVTDFLHLRFGALQTGIFNMADVSITVGAFIILGYAILKRKKLQLP